ncbi:MAG: carbohydrate ABC transporter permease [Anaerolineae bacterium]|nr:carbohydrate ABC transporter permease [Anaerolineae bacterium]
MKKRKLTLTQILVGIVGVIIAILFTLPMLWFVFAPFNSSVSLSVAIPERFTLENFVVAFSSEVAMRGLLVNSVIIGGGTMVGTAIIAAMAAYGISRGNLPGRQIFTTVLILFSSVVTGTASMIPIFLLIFSLGLIDTHLGVILVMIGGLLPAAIFIVIDFVDGVPRSYEEAAMISGAGPLTLFRDITFPLIRPGLMVVGIWALVNAWGSFLTPFILLRDPLKVPASVAFYVFYDPEGTPNIKLVAAYAVLYTIPVVLLYLLVNWRYGFSFFGGIKR